MLQELGHVIPIQENKILFFLTGKLLPFAKLLEYKV